MPNTDTRTLIDANVVGRESMWEAAMNFVAEQNVAYFRELLETETDPKKRAIIEELLRQEEAKIVRIEPARVDPG
jgi:hypothetical protein